LEANTEIIDLTAIKRPKRKVKKYRQINRWTLCEITHGNKQKVINK
jgi:hypothetical protein